MAMTDHDRKRLWGKSGNRCAYCRAPLTRPESGGAREAVIGQEAHIVGERPGSARYRPLPRAVRDAYENRILLCPTHHIEFDAQPEKWSEEVLGQLKSAHELRMQLRTEDPESGAGTSFEPLGPIELPPVIGGKRLLEIVGPALAYQFDHDVPETERERKAMRAVLDAAAGWGEMYADLDPGARIDAVEQLSGHWKDALEAHLLLYGDLVHMTVHYGDGGRDRWPVAVVVVRRARMSLPTSGIGAPRPALCRRPKVSGPADRDAICPCWPTEQRDAVVRGHVASRTLCASRLVDRLADLGRGRAQLRDHGVSQRER